MVSVGGDTGTIATSICPANWSVLKADAVLFAIDRSDAESL